MELTPETATGYVRRAFDEMLAVAERLGEERANDRPLGPTTNAVAALIVHCCGVSEFWLGHVGLGRDSHREREAEFTRTASLGELRDMADATCRQAEADLRALEAGADSPHSRGRSFLQVDDTDASLVLHVIEELFQHLGHAELAADALLQ